MHKNLVQERLGCSLDSLDADQIGLYLSDYDAYYHECGDTNYMKFICEKRPCKTENVYTLVFKADTDMEFTFSHVQTNPGKRQRMAISFIANQSLVE